ncbi:hypothetical protein CYMTET_53691 [Cymbomonas tetramitiformis]|uniref:Uncharacterized protein n=1 Tax=Cymbomonas tetramitiformis TaxID=36881 RepID=A0AAE0BGD3_9CHLO|nr:hypothetical protein CYMTET_53691 [Cymbomonas tetramitiformis]
MTDAAQASLASYPERRAPAPPRSVKRKTLARVNAEDVKVVESKAPTNTEDDDMATMMTVWKDSLKPVEPQQLVRHLVPKTMTTTDKPFDPREPAQLVYSPLDPQKASNGHRNEDAGNQWLTTSLQLNWLKIQSAQTVFVVRYRKTTDGNLEFLAGEGNTQRGVGKMFLDGKVRRKYIRSVAHSISGYLCLGGRSLPPREHGHMGLLHTLEQHFEDIQDGEKVAQDIMEHIYTDGSRKVGDAVHVLKMRSHRCVKAVYYIFEDEEYCRQKEKTVDLSFHEHYLLENTRKFNALRWVGHLEVATIHREPLSLFAQLLREEPEVESQTQPPISTDDQLLLLTELEERAKTAEEKVETLDGYLETLRGAVAVAETKAKELEETLEIKVEARNKMLRKTVEEKCAVEKQNASMEWHLQRHRTAALEKHKLRLSLEEQLKAALKKADELNEENIKLRGQPQHGLQVEESGICFTYPELEDKADDGGGAHAGKNAIAT